jgi:DNA-directed RNA polymerase subunit RPC12/RpoP
MKSSGMVVVTTTICFLDPQTSLYTCHVCNSNYNHSGNFKQHLLKHERESGSISATLMAQTGSNPHLTNVLQSAMADRVDSGDKPTVTQYQYQCEHCDRSFKHPGNYKQHLASHIKNTKFEPAISNTIQKVNAMFGQAQQQQQQQKASTSNDTMQMVACPECHLEFPGIDLLQAHISVSHKHLDVKLPNVDGEVSNGGDSSDGGRPSWQLPLDDSQLELYKCTVCSKGFQKMSKLTAHMKIHRYVIMLQLWPPKIY